MNGNANDLEKTMPEYIDLLRAMVEINSFTANAPGVNALGRLTEESFQALGFKAEYVQSENPQYGRHLFLYSSNWGEDRLPAVAMVSHLDTVFSPEEEELNHFNWRIEGDRIYGPGVVDIKGGTVMIRIVLDELRRLHPRVFKSARWLICLDATEETLSDDFGRLCLQRIPAGSPACLVFEGGTPHTNAYPIVTARKGRAELLITAAGRGAHAGNYHKLGANAVEQLAHTVIKIASLTDYDRSLTFNVGVIRGGSVVNRVPHFAEILVEMRAFDPEIFQQGLASILAFDGSTDVSSFDGYTCTVSVSVKSQTAPWPRNPKSDELFNLWNTAGAAIGCPTTPEQRGGLSDGNLIWNTIATIDGLGPAGNNAHCSERSPDGSKDQEFVLQSSFVPKARLNIAGICGLLGCET